ncbi:MAG: hypothetical protein U1F35_19440 [Steroidobacteraceae bacterium]
MSVRPMRLPRPCSSTKRYQYSVRGASPAASTRQVQSERASTLTALRPTSVAKSACREISTYSRPSSTPSNGRRVHSSTLWTSGSPEATPSA